MKNQYFGDVNDYRKFGLLRAIQDEPGHHLLVAWMLTPDDGSNDGWSRGYLRQPGHWRRHDPELFDGLDKLLRASRRPGVDSFARSGFLANASFHSALVPDDKRAREEWRAGLLEAAREADLVFLDPDNGIEVPSRPIGRKGSSKYVAWRELQDLWRAGASLVVYQHLPRVRLDIYTGRQLSAFREYTGAASVRAFHAKRVLYLCAIQERHDAWLASAFARVGRRWKGQIDAV